MSRMSPESVRQAIRRVESKYREKLEELAMVGDAAINQMQTELNGALLVNWLLVKRAGGELVIPSSEMTAGAGRLQSMYDKEKDEWKFIALDPEPKEETGTTEETQVDG